MPTKRNYTRDEILKLDLYTYLEVMTGKSLEEHSPSYTPPPPAAKTKPEPTPLPAPPVGDLTGVPRTKPITSVEEFNRRFGLTDADGIRVKDIFFTPADPIGDAARVAARPSEQFRSSAPRPKPNAQQIDLLRSRNKPQPSANEMSGGGIVDTALSYARAAKDFLLQVPADFAQAGRDFAKDPAASGRALLGGAVGWFGSSLAGLGEIWAALKRNPQKGEGRGPVVKFLEDAFGKEAISRAELDFARTFPTAYALIQHPEVYLIDTGNSIKELADKIRPEKKRQTLATDIADAVGQIFPQIALALATAGAGAVVSMYAQGADQMAERALESGKYGTAAGDAAILLGGAITAITEKTGLDRILRVLPPKVRNNVMRRLADIAAAGGVEAATEAAEGVLHNLTAMVLLDDDTTLTEGVLREAEAAGGAGAIARTLVGLIEGRRRAAEEAESTAQPAKIRSQPPAPTAEPVGGLFARQQQEPQKAAPQVQLPLGLGLGPWGPRQQKDAAAENPEQDIGTALGDQPVGPAPQAATEAVLAEAPFREGQAVRVPQRDGPMAGTIRKVEPFTEPVTGQKDFKVELELEDGTIIRDLASALAGAGVTPTVDATEQAQPQGVEGAMPRPDAGVAPAAEATREVQRQSVEQAISAAADTAPPVDVSKPTDTASLVYSRLRAGGSYPDIRQLRQEVEELTGEKIEPNTEAAKRVEEEAEAGIVMAAREIAREAESEAEALRRWWISTIASQT